MSLPALAAVAGLAVAAHFKRKGSAADLSEENKKKIIDLVKDGRMTGARALATELGLDRLDLSGANLIGSILNFLNLDGVNMKNTDLINSNLYYTSMVGANLTNANLAGANLTSANLTRANLTNANLTLANLTDAFIEDTEGIILGPSRTFVGIPRGYVEIESPFAHGRTVLRRTE